MDDDDCVEEATQLTREILDVISAHDVDVGIALTALQCIMKAFIGEYIGPMTADRFEEAIQGFLAEDVEMN